MNKISKNWFGGLFPALAVFILAVSGASARADTVIFDNGASSGTAPDIAVFFADGNIGFEAGNVFTPTTSGTANDIVFDGAYYNGGTPTTPPGSDNFLISLYDTSSGAPKGTPITSTLSDLVITPLATNIQGFTTYQYSGSLHTPFGLSDTTSYYLGIIDTETPYEEFGVSVTDTQGPATSEFANISGSFLPNPNPISLAFKLSGVAAVPEPSTWALLLGGLGLLAFCRLRTRRA